MSEENTSPENNNPKTPPEAKLTEGDAASNKKSSSEKFSVFSQLNQFFRNPLVLRIGVYMVTFVIMVLIVWGIGSLIVHSTQASPQFTLTPTEATNIPPESIPAFTTNNQTGGLVRLPEILTASITQVKERDEIITYTVAKGDTIFGIADKFGLKPETVLWSNRYTLGDTPDGLSIGFELVILPFDGLIHEWYAGDGLNGVSKYYGVNPDVIVEYPGNNLDPAVVGNYANPHIEPGTFLVVPGGTRPNVAWVIPRDNPASGNSYLGPGACSGILYGDVGTGSFVYPTDATWLSGYDYNPPVHNGLDFDGDFGSNIYAADTGVIVYSGWSDRGYGNLIVIDHDRGWQTYYAHLLDGAFLPCGSNVQKGALIAAMGSTGNSTGPHLHFEMRLNGHPVNPWQVLQ